MSAALWWVDCFRGAAALQATLSYMRKAKRASEDQPHGFCVIGLIFPSVFAADTALF